MATVDLFTLRHGAIFFPPVPPACPRSVVLVNGTSCRSAISTWVYPCASVEAWKEYPLTPLCTLVVRIACWMTASAWCVRGEDREKVFVY